MGRGKKRPMAAEPEQTAVNGSIVLEVLDCPLCFHPLKPPVFQCAVGHVVCSSCHGTLVDRDRCQACSAGGGYKRCFAVEHIVDAFRVPCSYGCAAVMRYHEREEHERSCPLAPCFCPEADCGFAGSTAKLQHHFSADHGWPSIGFKDDVALTLQVKEGTQVLHSDVDGGTLLLVRFTLVPPFGVAVTVVHVDPHAAAASAEHKFECHLCFACLPMCLLQFSGFQVRSSNLSGGGLQTEGGGSFLVPNVCCSEHPTGTITVTIGRQCPSSGIGGSPPPRPRHPNRRSRAPVAWDDDH